MRSVQLGQSKRVELQANSSRKCWAPLGRRHHGEDDSSRGSRDYLGHQPWVCINGVEVRVNRRVSRRRWICAELCFVAVATGGNQVERDDRERRESVLWEVMIECLHSSFATERTSPVFRRQKNG